MMDFPKFERREKLARFVFLIVFSAALFAACSRSESKTVNNANANSGGKQEEAISVTTDKAVARGVPAYIQATGSLVADETSNIASKVAGKVTNVYVNAGDFVRQGSVIIKLDENTARLQMAQAQAAVKQQQAGVAQAQARLGLSANGSFSASTIPEVRVAGANYEQALAQLRQAEANEKRYRELVETGDVAIMTYETYRTTRDTVRAQVNAAKQQLDAAVNTAKQNNQAIKSAQAAVEAAQTQVAIAQQAIADTIVRAPFSGFISARPTAVGEYVTTATPVATILRTNPIKLQVQVGEKDIPFIKIGMGISLSVDAYKDRKFAGTVSAINPSVDASSRTAIVEAQIENNDNMLRAGMFATAQITRPGGGQSVFVPKSAVYNDQNTQSYRSFVIQNGIAKLRVVQIGQEEDNDIEILSGINDGETVATSNLAQLYEGAKVQTQ
ncbi:MAG: efflux RND transporter periplasmic adaptor subunit [Pyrinomonadaceae bacterium]